MDTEVQQNKIILESHAIWSLTPNGMGLGIKLQQELKGSVHFMSDKLCEKNFSEKEKCTFKNLTQEIHKQFHLFSGHIFIFSTGIAVRIIAPLLKSKTIDPAVVVVDDNGNHAISLLSGHLGGANELAKKTAMVLQADAVITTATDANKLPAIDMIAKNQSIAIETPENIKHINMAFLKGEPVSLYDPFECIKKHLPKTFWKDGVQKKEPNLKKIFCSHKKSNVSRETLILRPPVLSVGIGCNRGTSCEDIRQFLLMTLKDEDLSVKSVYRFATTIVKEDEAGLLALSKEMKIPIDFYGKKDLNSVKTIKTPSKMVEKHLGVKSVCEAAAILSADNGELIVPKKKSKDVTIAIALKK